MNGDEDRQAAALKAAVEAIKVADTLFQRYRHDVARMGSTSPDDFFLALDQNYAGIWEQLELARQKLAQAGRTTAEFDELSRGMAETRQGYDEQIEERIGPSVGPDGIGVEIEQKVTRSVDAKRFRSTGHAIAALKACVPEGIFGQAPDTEVEEYLASQSHWRTGMRLGLWVSGIGVAVVALVALSYWIFTSDDYGDQTGRIKVVELQLKEKPCDKHKIIALVQLYSRADAHERAIERADRFIKECGEHRKLRWATFTTYKRMGDLDGAIREVSGLIKAVPHDWDYRWWRGEVHQRAGNLEAAITDYRQSVALNPGLSNVPSILVQTLEKSGRPCEAMLWLRTCAQARRPDPDQLKAALRQLEQKGCEKLRGRGSAVMALGESPCVEGTVHGRRPAKGCFGVYPGGPYVLLSRKLATQAGLELGPPLLLRAPTGGLYKTRLTTATKLSVAGAEAPKVPVAVTNKLPPGVDGLLGQGFLGRFATHLDQDGAVHLDPAAAAVD